MTSTELDLLRYPVGRFADPGPVSAGQIGEWIGELESFPAELHATVSGMDDRKLDTPYRDGGWTVRQVVHHLADSHMNAYIRFKLALTEDNPAIRPYKEALWAEEKEARTAPVAVSLDLLQALHRRWVLVLRNMDGEAWKRTYFHPESQRDWRLTSVLAMYAWHGRHHRAHITSLAVRMGW
jgi:uncharacterized damage-inducible protein DinB